MDISINNPKFNFTGYKSTFTRTLEAALTDGVCSKCEHAKMVGYISDFCDKKTRVVRKLGSGYYSNVYKIDDSYVLKLDKHTVKPKISQILFNNHKKFDNLKHYFGEFVAEAVNDFGVNLKILKNVYTKGKTIPAGVPEEYSRAHTYEERLKYYKDVYLPLFSKLPQKSFDGIAKDCAELNKMKIDDRVYVFDYLNPNNFVLAGKTLRIIDEVSRASTSYKKNCVADLLSVFVNNLDLDSVVRYDQDLVQYRKTLTKKIILAGVRHELPMCETKSDYGMWTMTHSLLDLDMSENSINDMADVLDYIVKNNKNPKKRIKLAKDYLENVAGL